MSIKYLFFKINVLTQFFEKKKNDRKRGNKNRVHGKIKKK